MCIRHHTHWSVESVEELGEVQQPLQSLQSVEEVVRVSKPEQRVSAQGLEDSGAPFAMV